MADGKLRVGFVGLGIMGGAMARNVLKAGYELTVFNRTPQRAEALRQAGATVAASPAAVAAASDIIVSCVSDSPDVREVVLDAKSGIIAGLSCGAGFQPAQFTTTKKEETCRQDACTTIEATGAHTGKLAVAPCHTIVVDCSTVAREVALECSAALAAVGAGFLDAPVSGGDVGARAGTLSIMVGGERAHFDRARCVLDAMGKTITYCGPSGSGYVVKLCNQILGALHLVAAAEALSLATAAGIDPAAMLAAVSSGAAGSWALSNLAPKMVRGDYAPGFFVDYQLKDLRLAHDAAASLKLPLPAAAMAETLFRAASSQGHGRDGTQAIYEVIQRLGK